MFKLLYTQLSSLRRVARLWFGAAGCTAVSPCPGAGEKKAQGEPGTSRAWDLSCPAEWAPPVTRQQCQCLLHPAGCRSLASLMPGLGVGGAAGPAAGLAVIPVAAEVHLDGQSAVGSRLILAAVICGAAGHRGQGTSGRTEEEPHRHPTPPWLRLHLGTSPTCRDREIMN